MLRRSICLRRAGAGVIILVAITAYLAGIAVALAVLGGSDGPGDVLAAGTCESVGLISVGDTGLCTHGPDPAPPGEDPATISPAEFGPAADFSSAVCTGTGTDGRRVQVIYARRFDAPNRLNEYLSSFRTWSAQASQIYTDSAAQTGGERYLRFVHDSGCVIDVDSVTLSAAGASDFNTMVGELTAKGYSSSNRKYLVFLDVNNDDICGLGTVYPDDSAGTGNTNNVVRGYALIYNGCWSNTRTIVHELGHNFGAVQASAPNATSWSHCTDEWDIMCYEDGSGERMVVTCPDTTYQGLLDCNHNDYFHTNPPAGNYLASHWNVARSGWLGISGAPPPSTVPANNLISRATVVGELPYLNETNTLWATTSPFDPITEGERCWGDFSKTVWYKFTAPATGDYSFDTIDSSYDTVIGTFSGTPSNLTRLKCNDDIVRGTLDSRVVLTNLAAGATVYVMVGAYPRPFEDSPPAPGGYLRFQVERLPKIVLSPTTGAYASEIQFDLSAFPANANVALTFDGAALALDGAPVTVRTDGDGTAHGSFRIPSAAKGKHTIGAESGDEVVTARVNVIPRLRVSPSGGGAGATVRISLTGYAAGETVRVRMRHLNGSYISVPVTLSNGSRTTTPTVSSRGSGSFTLTVPSYIATGANAIRADGTTTDSRGRVDFTVPGCSLPVTGYAGGTVTISCVSFRPGEMVDVYLRSTSTAVLASFTAGSDGAGNVAFKLPAAPGGSLAAIGKGRSSAWTASDTLTVVPYLRLTPSSGPAGTSISAKLYGLRPGETVCVSWAGATVTCNLRADSAGSSAGFTIAIPVDATVGEHEVTATGNQGSSASRTFTVTSGGTGQPEPTSTPTVQPTATVEPTITEELPATPLPTNTPTPEPTSSALPAETPTASATATPSGTPEET
jgi:hypothetical protein